MSGGGDEVREERLEGEEEEGARERTSHRAAISLAERLRALLDRLQSSSVAMNVGHFGSQRRPCP